MTDTSEMGDGVQPAAYETGPHSLLAIKPQGSPNPASMGVPDGVQSGLKLEQTRANIAYALLAILFLVVAFEVLSGAALSGACWTWGSYCKQANASLSMIASSTQPIFTAMIGLVGSVVGFYFGSKSQSPTGP
ncbi:MAG: hypothetical protein M3T55_03810 [Pseudomonadota bacterium]|nr:hypothetical protein [Pseudomonadota bacterium]